MSMTTEEILVEIEAARDGKRPARLMGESLRGLDLSEACLRDADLSDADMVGCDLSGATLVRADLSGADLSGANLREANFNSANLSGARLGRACLVGASLLRVDLTSCWLAGADLTGVYFFRAKLPHHHLPILGVLHVSGLPSGQATFWPTPRGWELEVGCWHGTVDSLREMIAGDSEWPEAYGDEIRRRRPGLESLCDMLDAHAASNRDAVEKLREIWPEGGGA